MGFYSAVGRKGKTRTVRVTFIDESGAKSTLAEEVPAQAVDQVAATGPSGAPSSFRRRRSLPGCGRYPDLNGRAGQQHRNRHGDRYERGREQLPPLAPAAAMIHAASGRNSATSYRHGVGSQCEQDTRVWWAELLGDRCSSAAEHVGLGAERERGVADDEGDGRRNRILVHPAREAATASAERGSELPG